MSAAEPLREEPVGPVEEIYYRKGDIDFCFLLNRRHNNLRVFDYRVGKLPAEARLLRPHRAGRGSSQGVHRRREAGQQELAQRRLFPRGRDPWLLPHRGRVHHEPRLHRGRRSDPGRRAEALGQRTPSKDSDGGTSRPRGLSFELVKDTARLCTVTGQLSEKALYAPFRRGVFHPDLALHGKIGKREFWIGAETDSSFGHAKVDLMTTPEKDTDLPA